MKRFTKALAAIMLTVAVVFAACTKDPDNGGNNGGSGGGNGGSNNGGGNSGGGTTEGVYLGIIGFNDDLKTKTIGLLNANSEYSYTNFISTLDMRDGTVLYHAVNKSLDWLQSATLPAQLFNVSLITFTDGLDNGSTMLNSNYNNPSDYLNAVSNRIRNDRVGGKAITAYAIGLRGSDVTDYAGFLQNLQKLSSSGNNYEVENWAEVKERFRQIARQLYNETAVVNAEVKIPGGKANGTIVRITFDNAANANASSQYIQGTYYREDGKGKLKNVSYLGLQSSSGSEVVSARQDGIFYWYNFSSLKQLNGNPFTNTSNMNMWYNLSTNEWQPESEFTPEFYTNISVNRKSAVAVLVLDCSSSLSNDFGNMKEAAIEFVELLNNYGNSNNGGGGNGGTTSYTVSVSANPSNGGTVSGSGTYNQGASCSVTASASNGYTFSKWTENGTQVSTNANYTFAVSGNRNLVAQFQQQSYTISVSATPSSGGTVSGGGTYTYGQSCTVHAYANNGYTFTNWTVNGQQVSTNADYTFTVTANRTLVAHFTYNPQAPTGAINGRFSVSAGQQVYFSQGNLQYKASNGTWRFATNQYDYIGDANSNISSSYSGWIDLFGWGTSGWNCGNTYYRPWDSNNSDGSLYGPPGQYNLTGSYANSDWGYYNAISNGGNQSHQWRTLTKEEWSYVFNTRSTTSGIRYAKAQVNNVNGVILLPDDWSSSYYSLSSTNQSGASFSSNVISSSTWTNSLEAHGAVFLPAAGYRYGTSVYDVGSIGDYWSASYRSSYGAYDVNFNYGGLDTGSLSYRYCGLSVRLVCPAE